MLALNPNKSHDSESHASGICTIIIYELYMTHGDIKLDQDYGDDEIRRAQNKINSERVEEYYASPSICSLELDSPV